MPAPDGRDLLRSSSDLLVLSVLADEPLYGYSIIKQVGARSEGLMRLTPGVLYPLLHQLEKQKLLTSSWETVHDKSNPETTKGRKRKWYRLTPKGKRRLQQRAAAHRAYQAVLEAFLPETTQGNEGVGG